MKSFGDTLKQARESRGVTLDAVAGHTRIARRYLDALERSDIEALPGGAFNKGYIRSYAQFLDIDPGPVLNAYRAQERHLRGGEGEEKQLIEDLSRLVARRASYASAGRISGPRALHFVLVLLALSIVGASGWLLTGSDSARMEPPLPPVPTESNEVPTPPPVVSTSTETRTPEPTEPPDDSPPPAARLSITGSGIGTAVTGHQLVGRGESFAEGTRVVFWTRALGGEKGDRLRHVWIHEGQTVMRAELEIGGPHWRTYSRYLLPPGSRGEWAVEARDAEGRVLAREEFSCSPAPSAP